MTKVRYAWSLFVLIAIAGFFVQAQGAAQLSEEKKAEARNSYLKLRASDPEYDEAMKLCIEHRDYEAQPKLEKLMERYPSDPTLLKNMGTALLMTEISLPDSGARKLQRSRGRKLLAKARELGAFDDVTDYYISVIPEDGGDDRVFSDNKEADRAMQEGETAFAKRDYTAAIAAYTKALMLQPGLYHAVLFIGDSYYADKQYATATDWFQRAVKMDPNKETAYRYWGDALMGLDRMDEARAKYLEAIVAEPASKMSWTGLKQWASRNQVPFSIPDVKAPKRTEISAKQEGQPTIVPDANASLNNSQAKDGTKWWGTYQTLAGEWQTKRFKEKYPSEKEYRHTLNEEKELLMTVAKSVNKDIEGGLLKADELDTGIALLLRLHKADMLEPYILLAQPDRGLAQDYPLYRAANREKLKKFLSDFIARKDPK